GSGPKSNRAAVHVDEPPRDVEAQPRALLLVDLPVDLGELLEEPGTLLLGDSTAVVRADHHGLLALREDAHLDGWTLRVRELERVVEELPQDLDEVRPVDLHEGQPRRDVQEELGGAEPRPLPPGE